MQEVTDHIRLPGETVPGDMSFRALGDLLVERWRIGWAQTPDAARGAEAGAAIAAFVAAEHVDGLDAAALERLRDQLGRPSAWSRPHAVAALASLVFGLAFLSTPVEDFGLGDLLAEVVELCRDAGHFVAEMLLLQLEGGDGHVRVSVARAACELLSRDDLILADALAARDQLADRLDDWLRTHGGRR